MGRCCSLSAVAVNQPRRSASAGFTLIEVLIAMVVLAVALGAAITATSRYAANSGYLRDRSLAHWVAMNRVNETLLDPVWPDIGTVRGDEQLGGHEWAWLRQVLATADEDVRRVEVEVRLSAGDDRPAARLVAFVGRPR